MLRFRRGGRGVAASLFCSSSTRCVSAYAQAHSALFAGSAQPKIAFLGTGPMALSMASSMLSRAKSEGAVVPKICLLTEQDSYYEALQKSGFVVVDERDGTRHVVEPAHLEVVRSAEEFHEKYGSSPPQLIFGTMQMGAKKERWGMVPSNGGGEGRQVTVLTAANGIPFSTMLEEVKGGSNTFFGHATLYAKVCTRLCPQLLPLYSHSAHCTLLTSPRFPALQGRVAITDRAPADDQPQITVTCTDNGKISVGAVGPNADTHKSHFDHVTELMRGPIYALEHSPNAAQEAMNKVIRNLTNCICLGVTAAQYPFSGGTSDIIPMRYGVHLEKKCFANTLNKATFQAGWALGLSPQEIAVQIVENLKYVMGPVANNEAIDIPGILALFEQGLLDILKVGKNSTFHRNKLFEELSNRIMKKELYNHLSPKEIGSTHPPTDAQAAAVAMSTGKFGQFYPVKPIENKVTELIRIGEKNGLTQMNVLYAFSELYDAYNEAVATSSVFELPASFYEVIPPCPDETRLLSNIDTRIMKLDWRKAEARNRSGISVAAQRKQWLGESAIRNAKLIGALMARGFTFLRFDVGGVGLEESEAVIEARKRLASGNNRYSPACEKEVLGSLAQFYTDTGAGRVFSPDEVMVLGMRAKGALPWMLDFVGSGPMFVPRPTYNPNPSAGLYQQRQVLSFDITGKDRYAPMIEALAKHKGSGIVVLPIIGNPLSTTLTEEEEQGFVDVLRNNSTLGFFGDHAYRGYNMQGSVPGKLTPVSGQPTRDVMEAGGFYDESPRHPITGKIRNFRVTTHSSSKLFNDASGPGTCAGHEDTITFLGDMLRGSYTQAHARDRKTIPDIVKNIDYDAPRRWMASMRKFSSITQGRVPGFRDLGYDCPPFICYEASEWLRKHDMHPEDAQHYFMSRSPGLCGIFGGFGPGSATIFRLGFTGENDPARAVLAAERFVEYSNDEEAIRRFKLRDDILTKTFFAALKEIREEV